MRYFFIPILLLLTACGREPKNEQTEETIRELVVDDSISAGKRSLYIEDRSLYSPEWIADFETNNNQYKSVRIMGEYMLVDNDTAYFPDELKLKQDYRFTGFTDTHFYQLTAKRINYTTIEYDFTLLENERAIYNRRGRGHLASFFFYGSETFTDDETGDSYLATEYYDKDPDGLVVDIGEPDEQGRIRANIKGLPANINANTDITLRQSH